MESRKKNKTDDYRLDARLVGECSVKVKGEKERQAIREGPNKEKKIETRSIRQSQAIEAERTEWLDKISKRQIQEVKRKMKTRSIW